MANRIHDILQGFAPEVTEDLDEAGYFEIDDDTKKLGIVAVLGAIGLGVRGKITKKLYKKALIKNEKVWPQVWSNYAHGGLAKGARKFAREYSVTMPKMGTPADFNKADLFVRQYYEQRGLDLVTSLSDTDVKRLKGYVWSERNLPKNEFLESLKQKYVFDGSGSRLNMIKNVEINRAEQGGEYGYAREEGYNFKTWHTRNDDRVRPEHADQEGMQIEIDGVFPNEEEFPGQYSINCRCWLTYEKDES